MVKIADRRGGFLLRWCAAVLLCAGCGSAATTPGAGSAAPGGTVQRAPLVTPRRLGNQRAAPWARVEGTPQGRQLTVWFSGGQPQGACNVLAAVDVSETATAVRIALRLGDESTSAVCPLVAVLQATQVQLSSPLGARQVIDGTTGGVHTVEPPA